MTDVVSDRTTQIVSERSVQTAKLSGSTSIDLGELQAAGPIWQEGW